MSSLVCLQSSDPAIRNVTLLYDSENDHGALWSGGGAAPDCSSTQLPSASSCVVCFQRVLRAVCSDLLKNASLVMEGGGGQIEITKSGCPALLGDAAHQSTASPGSPADHQMWWLALIPILILIIIAWVVYNKGSKCRKAFQKVARVEPSADPADEDTPL